MVITINLVLLDLLVFISLAILRNKRNKRNERKKDLKYIRFFKCVSQGKTRKEALANIEEAISLYMEVLEERGESIPEDKVEVVLI